jgi:hypothetical protein
MWGCSIMTHYRQNSLLLLGGIAISLLGPTALATVTTLMTTLVTIVATLATSRVMGALTKSA